MSYKVLQLSPLSTRSTHVKILVESPWSSRASSSASATFLHFWSSYDSGLDVGNDAATMGLNWNHLLGLVLAIGVSASVWAGVGMAISNLVK